MPATIAAVGAGGFLEPASAPQSVDLGIDITTGPGAVIVGIGIGDAGGQVDLLTLFGSAFRSRALRPFFGPAADTEAAAALLRQLDLIVFASAGATRFPIFTPVSLNNLAALSIGASGSSGTSGWRARIRAPHSVIR